jgi:hypothetical protein
VVRDACRQPDSKPDKLLILILALVGSHGHCAVNVVPLAARCTEGTGALGLGTGAIEKRAMIVLGCCSAGT